MLVINNSNNNNNKKNDNNNNNRIMIIMKPIITISIISNIDTYVMSTNAFHVMSMFIYLLTYVVMFIGRLLFF